MAITAIPSQAIFLDTEGFTRFNDDSACIDLRYCMNVARTDDSCVMVDTAAESGPLVDDGIFAGACGVDWTCGVDWSIAANVATKAAGTNTELTQDIGIHENGFFRVTFTIANLSGGTVVCTVGGEAVSASVNGTFTFYVETFSVWLFDAFIRFKGNVGAATYDLTNVSCVEMSGVGYRIIKYSDDSLIYESYDSADVEYGADSETERVSNKALLCPDWPQAVDDECVYLEIVNTYNPDLILNGTFDSGANWNLGADWTIGAGVADVFVAGVTAEAVRTMDQTVTLTKGTCWTLTFDMLNFNLGSLDIKTDIATHVTGINGNGAKTVTIDLTLAVADATVLKFVASDIAADFEIDNVVVIEDLTCKIPDLSSETFCVGDLADFPNTRLLTFTNDENFLTDLTFVDYTNFPSYIQQFRLDLKTWKPSWPVNTKATYNDSAGNRTLNYSNYGKIIHLQTPLLPEYVLDILRAAIAHDTFTVDAIEHVFDGSDYDPNYPQDSLGRFGSVDVEIQPALYLRENPAC